MLISYCYTLFYFRYPEQSPRHHQRGLIIYGAETVQTNLTVNVNHTSTTTVSPLVLGLHDVNNATKFDTNTTKFIPSLNKIIFNSTLQQRCPLIPPNLGKHLIILIFQCIKITVNHR